MITKELSQKILTPEQILARQDLRVYEVVAIKKTSAHYPNTNNIKGSILTPRDNVKQDGPWFHGTFNVLKSEGFLSGYLAITGAKLIRLSPFYLTYTLGSENGGTYSEVWSRDRFDARHKVFNKIGDKWAFIYAPKDFAHQPTRFGLTRNEDFLIL